MGLGDLTELGAEKLGEGKVVVGVDSAPLKRGLDEVGETVTEHASNWGAAFKVAKIGVVALTTAFIGFAIEGAKKADELDAAVARIGAQVGLTVAQSAKLRAGLLDMSTRTKQGVDELAKSVESVAKAGYNVDDALRIQEASAKAATVTNADLGTVTNTVVTAMKAWGIEGKNVGGVVDTLITTVGRSRIDWESLSRVLATAAPIAKDAGLSFADLNAAIIAVGRSGLPARRAAAGVIALIRSLSSPTAQKEMKLLGLTVNSTTIAHDGLLATLQKIEKASGKHVAVLVKNKKGQVDLAKSVAATTKANQGQLQALQAMFGGASGLVTADILLANGAKDYKEAQDALNHSLGKTNEEFDKVKEADLGVQLALIRNTVTKFAIELGTTILPYAAKFLQWVAVSLPTALRGIGDLWNNTLSGPIGAMVKSFMGFAEALINALTGWSSGSAQNAQSSMLSFFGGLSSIVVTLATDLGGVFDVLKFILNLPFAGAALKALVFIGVLRGAVSLAKALGGALTGKALGALNFATGGIFKLTGGPVTSEGSLVESARATTEAAARTGEAATKTGEAATKTGEAAAKTGEAAAKSVEAANASAEKLAEAAVRLTEAASVIAEKAEIGGAAETFGGAVEAAAGSESFNALEAIRSNTYNESTIEVNQLGIESFKAQKAAAQQSMTASQTSIDASKVVADAAVAQTDAAVAQTSAAKATTAAVTKATDAQIAASDKMAVATEEMATKVVTAAEAGAAAEGAGALAGGGGLKGLVKKEGGAKGLLGAAGGLISGVVGKAIVPLLVAQLASDIVKAPLGDFVATNLGKARVGAKMKDDFFGGLVDLFRVQMETGGNDSWVGRAESMQIGKGQFNTISLAKVGITNATFDQLEAKEGTIEHAVGVSTAADQLTANLGQQAGEDIGAYYKRVRDHLPEEIQKTADDIISQGTIHTGKVATLSPEAKKALSEALYSAVAGETDDLRNATREALLGVLTDQLTGAGFTKADVARLDTGVLKHLGDLALEDTQGTFGYVRDFIVESALHGATDASSPAQRVLSASTKKRVAAFTKAFGKNWEDVLAKVQFGTPTTRPQKQLAAKLKAMLGGNWQQVLQDTFNEMQIGVPRTAATASQFKKTMATLRTDQAEALKAEQDYFTNFPPEVQAAMTTFVNRLHLMAPGVVSKLNKEFHTQGDDWITALRDGTGAITDPAAIKELTRVFGTQWKTTLMGFGSQLFAKEGGTAAAALKAAMRTAIGQAISQLSTTGLDPGKHPTKNKEGVAVPTSAQAAKDKAAIAKYLSSTTGAAALAAASSPDAVTAKKGMEDLGKALTKDIPNDSERNRFIGTLTAIQKFSSNPAMDKALTWDRKSEGVTSAMNSVSYGLDRLSDSAVNFIRRYKQAGGGYLPSGGGGSGIHYGGKSGRPVPNAMGSRFSTSGTIYGRVGSKDITIGEAGSEDVAVLAKPRHVGWGDLMGISSNPGAYARLPGALTRGAPMGGGNQHIHVDNMSVQSRSEEQAILDILSFMAPGGFS